MSLLEAMQYEKELLDIEIKSKEVGGWYKENPEELERAVERLNQFRYKVCTSRIKDSYKSSMIEGANKSLELLGYKQTNSEKNENQAKNDSILSYIIPAGLMLIPLILNEIFPERPESKVKISDGTDFEDIKHLLEAAKNEPCRKG